MSIPSKVLQLWTLVQLPSVQCRLILVVLSTIILILVADTGYVTLPSQVTVCVFNGNNYVCRMVFFCTFITIVTCLVFLALEPYLPDIQVIDYLRWICLIDVITGVLFLFVWALGSAFLLEEWTYSEITSSNVHSTRSIIALSTCGAACWILTVMHLTKRLKEVNDRINLAAHKAEYPGAETEKHLS